jgi:hypothetical protein
MLDRNIQEGEIIFLKRPAGRPFVVTDGSGMLKDSDGKELYGYFVPGMEFGPVDAMWAIDVEATNALGALANTLENL